MTGSRQIAAIFIDSNTTPWLMAPSPKKHTTAWPVFCIFAERAAPPAIGAPLPTIPVQPMMYWSRSAMCMEPPLPLLEPVALAKSSAIISGVFIPLAMQWPWPRWFDTM